MMRLHVIAGEASGDTHGAGVLAQLRHRFPELEIRGLGGPKIHALAGKGVENWIEQAAVVGLWDVLKHYPWFRRQFARQRALIAEWRPDALLLIDYPGFNLRLAEALRADLPQLKILYYISPQVWAWHRGRIPKMAKWLDLMVCIFPFEAELYNASGLRTVFGGHPMVDHLAPQRLGVEREAGLIALLPGSRRREVSRLFPVMLEAAALIRKSNPDFRFAAAAASEKMEALMRSLAGDFPIAITLGGASELMQRAAFGWVASGTATLEAAYFGLPYALVYKVAWLTYAIGRRLVRVPFLGIVNILAGREVVREFIQGQATPEKLAAEALRVLEEPSTLQKALAEVIAGLGGGGAYAQAAGQMAEVLRENGPREVAGSTMPDGPTPGLP